MSHPKRKPLLYILQTGSDSLQTTVSSAINNVANLNKDNQLTSDDKKPDISQIVARLAIATVVGIIIPYSGLS